MDSIYISRMLTLVDPHEEIKHIGCEWAFKRKTDINDNVHKYKARLIVKCYK